MPLILDPDTHPEPVLRALVAEFTETLTELRGTVAEPHGRVIDPGSLETARELLDAALAQLEHGGDRTPAELAADANLGYATMMAVIDLVISHTDVPRVPRSRKDPASTAP